MSVVSQRVSSKDCRRLGTADGWGHSARQSSLRFPWRPGLVSEAIPHDNMDPKTTKRQQVSKRAMLPISKHLTRWLAALLRPFTEKRGDFTPEARIQLSAFGSA